MPAAARVVTGPVGAAVGNLRAKGAKVDYAVVPDANHGSIPAEGLANVLTWMRARLQG